VRTVKVHLHFLSPEIPCAHYLIGIWLSYSQKSVISFCNTLLSDADIPNLHQVPHTVKEGGRPVVSAFIRMENPVKLSSVL